MTKRQFMHPWFQVSVDVDGTVYGKLGSPLTPNDNGLGYLRVRVSSGYRMVHRLVWEAVNGDIPSGLQVDHIDGNKSNNSLSNLQLVTASENTARYHKQRILSGRPHSCKSRRKLSRDDAMAIKSLLSSGVGRLAIAKAYGVTRSCIRHIDNGLNHASI